jgi:hypothetical protein
MRERDVQCEAETGPLLKEYLHLFLHERLGGSATLLRGFACLDIRRCAFFLGWERWKRKRRTWVLLLW